MNEINSLDKSKKNGILGNTGESKNQKENKNNEVWSRD